MPIPSAIALGLAKAQLLGHRVSRDQPDRFGSLRRRSQWRTNIGAVTGQITVAADALIGKDAVGACLDPIYDVLTAAGPEEMHANAKEHFINAKVTTNRAAMENIKDKMAKGGGDNNQ
jgi:hypothetical protein